MRESDFKQAGDFSSFIGDAERMSIIIYIIFTAY